MQLKITTDYAVRTLLFLAETGRITTSIEISEAMQIPREYLVNIMRDMREGGLVQALSGAKGGYSLARAPEEITLYDVIEVMERTIRINRCLEPGEPCSRGAARYCKVRQVYQELQDEIECCFKNHTIDRKSVV